MIKLNELIEKLQAVRNTLPKCDNPEICVMDTDVRDIREINNIGYDISNGVYYLY